MIPFHIKEKILKNVVYLRQFGLNDLTWEKENARELIISLMNDEIGILGGNVYKVESNHLVPMYDNWSCTRKSEETNEQFFLRSKEEALDYISKYPVYQDEKILFSIGFTEIFDD